MDNLNINLKLKEEILDEKINGMYNNSTNKINCINDLNNSFCNCSSSSSEQNKDYDEKILTNTLNNKSTLDK